MEEADRIRVVEHINGDDAPSLGEWIQSTDSRTVSPAQNRGDRAPNYPGADESGRAFRAASRAVRNLGTFLSRFSMLVMKETDGKVKLDGRRLDSCTATCCRFAPLNWRETRLWKMTFRRSPKAPSG